MTTAIQIKRSANAGAPSIITLAEGELAYSQDRANDGANAVLYIESIDSSNTEVIHKVGGKYYTDIIDSASSLNSSYAIVRRDANGDFTANVITADTFVGNLSGLTLGNITTVFKVQGDDGLATFVSGVANVLRFDGTDGINTTVSTSHSNVFVTIDTNPSGVAPGIYGGTTAIPVLTVNDRGVVTGASNVTISTAANAFSRIYVEGSLGGNITALGETPLTITTSGIITANTNPAANSIHFSVGNSFFSFYDTNGDYKPIPIRTTDSPLNQVTNNLYVPFVKSDGTSVTTLRYSS